MTTLFPEKKPTLSPDKLLSYMAERLEVDIEGLISDIAIFHLRNREEKNDALENALQVEREINSALENALKKEKEKNHELENALQVERDINSALENVATRTTPRELRYNKRKYEDEDEDEPFSTPRLKPINFSGFHEEENGESPFSTPRQDHPSFF